MDVELAEQFTLLVAQHTRQLQRYVVTLLAADSDAAEDVLQEVLLALWKKFPEFDPARPFLPWAFRFAYYEALNHRRKGKSAHLNLVFDDVLLEKVATTYTDRHDLLEARRATLRECLQKLPPSDRQLVQVRYESDQTIQEVARCSNLPISKLYNGLRRIRGLLMDCVERHMGQAGGNEA